MYTACDELYATDHKVHSFVTRQEVTKACRRELRAADNAGVDTAGCIANIIDINIMAVTFYINNELILKLINNYN